MPLAAPAGTQQFCVELTCNIVLIYLLFFIHLSILSVCLLIFDNKSPEHGPWVRLNYIPILFK